MGEIIKDIKDQLKKLAEIAEIIDNSFLKNENIELKVSLNEDTFNSLIRNLNYNTEDGKCIVSIDNVEFTFLKK